MSAASNPPVAAPRTPTATSDLNLPLDGVLGLRREWEPAPTSDKNASGSASVRAWLDPHADVTSVDPFKSQPERRLRLLQNLQQAFDGGK